MKLNCRRQVPWPTSIRLFWLRLVVSGSIVLAAVVVDRQVGAAAVGCSGEIFR